MKANSKFVNIKGEDEAVSAVIGVILMVAITVAIAATVYVYVTSMMTEEESAPVVLFKYSDSQNNLQITKVSTSAGATPWTDIKVTASDGLDISMYKDVSLDGIIDTVNTGRDSDGDGTIDNNDLYTDSDGDGIWDDGSGTINPLLAATTLYPTHIMSATFVPGSDEVEAGQIIYIGNVDTIISISHIPTGTLLGTYTYNAAI